MGQLKVVTTHMTMSPWQQDGGKMADLLPVRSIQYFTETHSNTSGTLFQLLHNTRVFVHVLFQICFVQHLSMLDVIVAL